MTGIVRAEPNCMPHDHPSPLVFSGFSWGVGLGVGEHGGPINEGNYVVYSGRVYKTLVL